MAPSAASQVASANSLVITQSRPKADQEDRGRRIGIPHARGRWCPVREVQAWVEVAEIEEGPLLRSLRKGTPTLSSWRS